MDVNSRVFKSIAFGLSAVITVTALNIIDCGSASEVNYQLVENTVAETSYVDYREEEDVKAERLLADSRVVDVTKSSMDNYTYVLDESTLNRLPEIEFTYDGTIFWVKDKTVKLKAQPNADAEDTVTLNKADRVTRISLGDEWSYIRDASGNKGYVLTASLSEKEIVLPTPTSTPKPTKKPTKKPTATPKPTKKATATPKPTKASGSATPTTPSKATPVATATTKPSEITETEYNKTLYTTTSVNVRKGPDTSYKVAYKADSGAKLTAVAKTSNGWIKLDDGNYIMAKYVTATAPSTSKPGDYDSFASYVRSFLGVKYVYAGADPTKFDCSGLVMYCFKQYYGISLPHSAHADKSRGKAVDKDDIKSGDCVLFDYDHDGRIDHIGIYVGNNTVIHASSSKGKVVASTYSAMTCIDCIRRYT